MTIREFGSLEAVNRSGFFGCRTDGDDASIPNPDGFTRSHEDTKKVGEAALCGRSFVFFVASGETRLADRGLAAPKI
jgi:hypothetical protein